MLLIFAGVPAICTSNSGTEGVLLLFSINAPVFNLRHFMLCSDSSPRTRLVMSCTSSTEDCCCSRGFAITHAVRGFLELLRLIRLSSYSLRPWDTLLIYSRSSAHFGRLIFAECLRLTPSFWSSIGRWVCHPNHGLTKTPERLCHSSFLNRQERSADSPSPESNRPNQSRDTKSVAIIREIL